MLSDAPDKAKTLSGVRSPRLIRHAELDTLTIAHVDCDAFYATIENATTLADRQPLIVGGRQARRGGDLLLISRCTTARCARPCRCETCAPLP